MYEQVNMVNISQKTSVTELLVRRQWQIIASILVISAFILGGSSRGEVSSLNLLRPLAVLIFGAGLLALGASDMRKFPTLLLTAVFALVLCVIQIIPLPSGIAGALAGHDLVSQVDNTVGISSVRRPISMVPGATWNALWAMFVPLALLLLMVKLSNDSETYLLPVIFCIGAVTALLAMAQILGDPQSVLFFYEVTNRGIATGLFANRNHQAVFLAALLPLIFAYARLPHNPDASSRIKSVVKYDPRLLFAVAGSAIIIPLILISGSRAGLMAMIIASLGVVLVLVKDGHGSKVFHTSSRVQALAVLGGIVILVFLSLWLDRGLAVDRLMGVNAADDLRYTILPTMRDMVSAYAPWGSGFGSFDKVYRAAEPSALLIPQYMNQAHNDWLDVLLTGGLPAIGLALFACAAWAMRAFRVFSQQDPDPMQPLRKAALVVLLILAVASASDYPLRTPALACFFVLAVFWAAIPFHKAGSHLSHQAYANN